MTKKNAESSQIHVTAICLSFIYMLLGILDEEGGDTLVNVNMLDDERAAKNVTNKKKKPDYRPYDEPELDEYGMVYTHVGNDRGLTVKCFASSCSVSSHIVFILLLTGPVVNLRELIFVHCQFCTVT